MIHPSALLLALLTTVPAADDDPTRVLPAGKPPTDARLGKPKTLNDDFPFEPPTTREAWEHRKNRVREQVLVANGLWPLPEKTPLNPVIHGKIDRDDYTVEKVFFASLPGHYVSGNLYRPKGKTGKVPGVLCPHGHWRNGRFYDAGEKAAQAQIAKGAEKTIEGARYPLQARCVSLARMGCVVFHYDMVGNADSTSIPHRAGFTDAEAELRAHNFMGLQTWNSIRALDFLVGLPDVDAKRIGVTGASGGGTQTFILGAVDDRPAVAFPAVMVSTAMQGGCICENCSYLRIGTGNVELAGLFAPKPLAMSGAKDWTIDIETKGLPELKKLYALYGAEDKVAAKCFPQFEHNYNQVAREMMYGWFNTMLGLGLPEPVVEKPFIPVPPAELSVYDEMHPRPKDSADAATLRKTLTARDEKQLSALTPKDPASLATYKNVVGTALRVMCDGGLPAAAAVEVREVGGKATVDGVTVRKLILGRKGAGETVPAIAVAGPEFDGTVVIWVHPAGKASLFHNGQLVPAARALVSKNAGILAVDVFGTGELKLPQAPAVNAQYAGYTFGYNRPLAANRVRDILTTIAAAKARDDIKTIHLAGFDAAGPWVVLAKALAGEAVARTTADVNGFDFSKVTKADDEMMLPAALKYGGLPGFAALAAPGEVLLGGATGFGLTEAAYKAGGGGDKLTITADTWPPERLAAWLLK